MPHGTDKKSLLLRLNKPLIWQAAIAAVIIFLLYGLGILATAILRSKGVQLADIQLGLPYLIRNALPNALQGVAYVVLFLLRQVL